MVSEVARLPRFAALAAGALGGEEFDRYLLRRISAIQFAAASDVPVLLVHGTVDTVVRQSQSIRMRMALRRAGQPVTFVELRGADHWLSSAGSRLEVLRALEAFLAEHL